MPSDEASKESKFVVTYNGNNNTFKLTDINYDVVIGYLGLHEGPGWVLTKIETSFLDGFQLATLAKYIERLNKYAD